MASIQPRTGLSKFAKNYPKLENSQKKHRLILNFAQQVSYTIHLRKQEVDEAIEVLAAMLGPPGHVTPADDIEGHGNFGDGRVDIKEANELLVFVFESE